MLVSSVLTQTTSLTTTTTLKHNPLPLSQLWERLTDALRNIYDAHHVCVAAAQAIAEFTQIDTVVLMQSSLASHFDVWRVRPNQGIEQLRWWDEDESLLASVQDLDSRYLDKSELATSPLSDWIDKTFLFAPFQKSNITITSPGAIGLIDPPVEAGIDTRALGALANYMTIYLERAMLRYKTVQQEITFDVVNDITISLTSTLSLEDIFDRISSPIRRIINVESVSIGLYDSYKEELVFVKALMGPLFADLPELKVKAGQGIAGWVAKHAKPLLVNDVYADERFYSEPDQESGFQTDSILAVPLIAEKDVVGVLEVINKQVGSFDGSDLHLLQAIASPLAIALENARLHTEVVAEKRRIEAIFDNMSEGMLTVDGAGLISSVNDSLLSLLQVDILDIVGTPIETALKARRRDFAAFVRQVMSSKHEVPSLACDVYAEHRADAVPTMVGGAAIREDDGQISETIFVFSDLRQIREVERMRDDFFHNIVHELRTPLATILMYARLLRKSGDNPKKAARFLDTIERESDRLQMMVRQMLALAKLEAREMQRSKEMIDMNRLFDEIVPPLSDAALAKGLTFMGDIRPNLPQLHGDREIIYSIFKNLIDNGIKFTREGAIRVEAWEEEGWLLCEVEDDGIGIPKEAMPNLFKRFYRTQTAVEHGIAGTGLGLYMVKEGIEKHGGTINVRSGVGLGTLFIVRLPVE